jgi:hypothetical protein
MKNTIAQFLRVLAIIVFFVGGFFSLLFMQQPDVLIVAVLVTMTQGMLLLGLAEVIRLLQKDR